MVDVCFKFSSWSSINSKFTETEFNEIINFWKRWEVKGIIIEWKKYFINMTNIDYIVADNR
jgi:hypothetical protein